MNNYKILLIGSLVVVGQLVAGCAKYDSPTELCRIDSDCDECEECYVGSCVKIVGCSLCGNGKVDTWDGETCDGNCPDRCYDGDPCTEDLYIGSEATCNVICEFAIMAPGDCCKVTAFCITEEHKITANDAQGYDRFGQSVSISGEFAIIGAPNKDGPFGSETPSAGVAYVFQSENGQWVEKVRLTAFDTARLEEFGSSVSIDGVFALVGAPRKYGENREAGAVYVFRLTQDKWVLSQKLTASEEQSVHLFGQSVAINRDVSIIGAYGSAYIFRFENGEWLEKQKLVSEESFEGFGESVSISEGVAIVGIPFGPSFGGQVDIFQLVDGMWRKMQKLTSSDGQVGYRFGESVSIDGDSAIVGAPFEPGGHNNSIAQAGAAYHFRMEDGRWIQKQRLTASVAEPSAHYGSSVSIRMGVVVIGTSDFAHIFKLENERLVEKNSLSASDAHIGDKFGYSVATSGDVTIVGAPFDDGSIGNPNHLSDGPGAAYIFSITDHGK